jgi:hypothetical protein
MKTKPERIVRNETPEEKEKRLEKEHEWRQILQNQFAELWFRLNLPETADDKEPQRKEIKLDKIRGSGGKAA